MVKDNYKVIILKKFDNVNESESFLTINDIFESNVDLPKSLFINEYQRPYCWGKKQIEELFNDTDQCISNDDDHFTGILYFGRNITNRGCSIIDGQQRLITIFLFLVYLQHKDNFDICIKIKKESKRDEFHSLKTFIDSQPKQNFENNLLNDYKKSIVSNKTSAWKVIKNLFADKNNEYRKKFIEVILNKLYFLAVKCDDEKSENILFRIVNAKGQQLDDIDKIKSYILQNFYTKDEETNEFIQKWTILNKNGKKSLNMFFKLLMNDLTNNKNNSNGKVKYDNFLKVVSDLDLKKFKEKFNSAIARFEWIPKDIKDKNEFSVDSELSKNKNWCDIRSALFLFNELGLREKMTTEIGSYNRFEKYKSGELNPIILFLLYLFTYICVTNYSFKDANNVSVINEFQGLSSLERKQKLKELWKEFKNSKKLDEIQYKLKDINDQEFKIRQKHKCIYPFLILILCYQTQNFYDQINQHLDIKKAIDHYIPKKINNKSVKKTKRAKEFSLDNNEIKKITPELCKLWNLNVLADRSNKNKSNLMPIEFLVESQDKNEKNKYSGIDFEKIKNFLSEQKKNILKKLDYLINELTK